MKISECNLKGTGILSTKRFFDFQFGSDYWNSNILKYYPEKSFTANQWYPMNPLVKFHYDAAAESNKSFKEITVQNSRFVLENDLNGVYKFFLKLGGIKRVLEVMPQLAKAYTNCLAIKIIENKDGYYKAEVRCLKHFLEFTLCTQEGTLIGILNVCERKLSEIEISEMESTFDEQTEYVNFKVEIRYS